MNQPYRVTKEYDVGKYPDGQIYVRIKKPTNFIAAPINSYEDLFILQAVCDAHYHQYGEHIETLRINCLFGQRSDRRFSPKESFDLKLICDSINSCQFKTVLILDPHSDVCLGMINGSVGIHGRQFISLSIKDIETKYPNEDVVLVSPDAGAYKKVAVVAENLKKPMVSANKTRDREGKIDLIFNGEVNDQVCLIVDDIADGGYTFHLLATELKRAGAKKVYLYVTHGFFFKGFDLLKENIDGIYTTNSTGRTFNHPIITQWTYED